MAITNLHDPIHRSNGTMAFSTAVYTLSFALCLFNFVYRVWEPNPVP